MFVDGAVVKEACDGTIFKPKCRSAKDVIMVEQAWYGTLPDSTCTSGSGTNQGSCLVGPMVDAILKKCMNVRQCEMSVTHKVMEACNATQNTLKVYYRCVPSKCTRQGLHSKMIDTDLRHMIISYALDLGQSFLGY